MSDEPELRRAPLPPMPNSQTEKPRPPRPDPESGYPRPPRAPVDTGSGGGSGSSEKNQQYKPTPPPGQGRTLEWYKASRRRSIITGLGGVLVVSIGATLNTGDLEWMSIWWMWLFPLVAGLLIGLTVRAVSCAAGAEWFAVGNNWVELYDLSSVKVKVPTHYRDLELKDQAGRQTRIQLMTIQHNQDLWDLVYNGILHSVVEGGAETNKLARKVLRIPAQPSDSAGTHDR